MNPAPPVTSTLYHRMPTSELSPSMNRYADGRTGRRIDPDVAADQAVFDPVGEVGDHRALEHDAVLDLGVLQLDAVADRRERPDVRSRKCARRRR